MRKDLFFRPALDIVFFVTAQLSFDAGDQLQRKMTNLDLLPMQLRLNCSLLSLGKDFLLLFQLAMANHLKILSR